MTGDGPAARPAGGGHAQPRGGAHAPGGDAHAPGGDARHAGEPALTVVAGQPSAEELAALTVALSAVLATRGGPAGRPGRAASGWADRSAMMGVPPSPGPDAWRRSTWPR
jgi:hypothetical protein